MCMLPAKLNWGSVAFGAATLVLVIACSVGARSLIRAMTGEFPRDVDFDLTANNPGDWLWGPVTLALMLVAAGLIYLGRKGANALLPRK